MKQNKIKLKSITEISLISAIYVTISMMLIPFSFGVIQIRVAEALTIMPVFKKMYIYGLTLGCFLTNLMGYFVCKNTLGIVDIIIGSSATFISGILTYYFRNYKIKNLPILATLFPVVINAVIIGGELTFFMKGTLFNSLFWLNSLSVGIGQFVSCSLIGLVLYIALKSVIFTDKS